MLELSNIHSLHYSESFYLKRGVLYSILLFKLLFILKVHGSEVVSLSFTSSTNCLKARYLVQPLTPDVLECVKTFFENFGNLSTGGWLKKVLTFTKLVKDLIRCVSDIHFILHLGVFHCELGNYRMKAMMN